MRGKLLTILVVLTFLLGLVPVYDVEPTEAQGDVCEDGVCQGTIDAGGKTHLIAYAETMTEDAESAKQAVRDAVDFYQPMFGLYPTQFGNGADTTKVPFIIFLGLTPTTEDDTEAESTLNAIDSYGEIHFQQRMCAINLNFVEDPDLVRMIVAHEIAHCYLYVYTQAARGDDIDYWWNEGSAEWLATQVYPDLASSYIAQSTQGMFRDGYASTLFLKKYDAFYFWEVMRALEGSDVVIDRLVHMPAANTVDEFATYLRSSDAELRDLFNQFARRIYRDKVAYQPARSSLYIPEQAIGQLPAKVSLQPPWFSIGYLRLILSALPHGQVLRMVVSNTEQNQVKVAMVNGESSEALSDGVPLDFCGPESVDLIISRVGETEVANFNIDLTAVDRDESSCPRDLPNCMVGRWYVRTIPADLINSQDVSSHFEYDPENYYFEFKKDATFQATLIAVSAITTIGESDSIPANPGGALVVGSDTGPATVITSINAQIEGLFSVASFEPTDTEFVVIGSDAHVVSSAITVQMGDEIMSIGSIPASDLLPAVSSFECKAQDNELWMKTTIGLTWVLNKTP